MKKYVLFTFLLFFLAACSNDDKPGKSSDSVQTRPQTTTSTVSPAASQQSAPFKIIFFLNPNGSPCRLQADILNNMANELRGAVDIQYVQATVPEDMNIFYQYGIRSLPTLLLADASGKEIKRMPPGVKRPEDIRLLIQSIPHS